MTPIVDAGPLGDRGAQAHRRRIRVERQQDDRVRAPRVRGIDTRRRADEAVEGLRDDERRPRADDLSCSREG